MRKNIVWYLVLLICLAATPAWAIDMEYYTYGGFDAIALAFQKIALIFSDAGYQALFFVVIVAAIFLGVMSTWFGALRGAKVSPLGWAPPILLGVGLYLALVVPKGNITVYDPLLNRFQIIGNVPDGIVLVAGSLNKIEEGLVNIIDTSGNVEGYRRTAGGMGFNILYQATKGGFGLGNTSMGQTVMRYTKDCVMFEMMRPGTALTTERILKNTQNAVNEFSEAASPAIWTVYYNAAHPEGVTGSCQESWMYISTYLSNSTNLQSTVKEACSAMGFNVSNANELQRCRENMTDFTNYLYGGTISVTPEEFMRQIGMMEALDGVLKSENPDMALMAMSNKGMMTSGISMGMVANEWLPVMRAVFTAVAIGLIPFLCLFLPTGIVGKATGIICGFFVWLTCWGITDAILHGIATDYAIKIFEQIKASQLGYNAIMMFPSQAEKALSMFGFVRTAGIMLATVMTGMLISFGGHALSMMASNIQGSIQSYAGQGGMAAADPIGNMQSRQQLLNTGIQQGSINAWDNEGKGKWNAARTMGATSFQSQFGNAEGQQEVAGALGMGTSVKDLARGNVKAGVKTAQGDMLHSGAVDGKGQFHNQSSSLDGGRDMSKDYKLAFNEKGQVVGDAGMSMQVRDGKVVSAALDNKSVNFSESEKASMQNTLANQLSHHVDGRMSHSELVKLAQSNGATSQEANQWAWSVTGSDQHGVGAENASGKTKINEQASGTKTADSLRGSVGINTPVGGLGAGRTMEGSTSSTQADRQSTSSGTKENRSLDVTKGSMVGARGETSSFSRTERGLELTKQIAESQGWSDVSTSAQQVMRMNEAGTTTQTSLNPAVINNMVDSGQFKDAGDRFDQIHAAGAYLNNSRPGDQLVETAVAQAKDDYLKGSNTWNSVGNKMQNKQPDLSALRTQSEFNNTMNERKGETVASGAREAFPTDGIGGNYDRGGSRGGPGGKEKAEGMIKNVTERRDRMKGGI